jgi:hypothetical protein
MDGIRAWRPTFGAVALSLGGLLIDERLREAYFEHLKLIAPNPEVPVELQAHYRDLMGQLERLYPSRRRRRVANEEASEIAKQLIAFYDNLLRSRRAAR